MTYRPNAESERWEAPAGVAPWRDLTDPEFEELDAKFGPLGRFFDHVGCGPGRHDTTDKKKRGEDRGRNER